MKALITGASSGIGRDIAIILSKKGFDLIIVARNEEKLLELKTLLSTNVKILTLDLSIIGNCFKLYEQTKNDNVDILINNAGYGIFGEFINLSVEEEMNMIDLNIKAVHILTKLFLKDFISKDSGHIMNVSSSAGFLPAGPLLSSYYASKTYVKSLSLAIYDELRASKKNVGISILCPGPVKTDFNNRAGVAFTLKSLESQKVAEYAVNKMLKRKLIIIPGFFVKLGIFCSRFSPTKLTVKVTHNFQIKKR